MDDKMLEKRLEFLDRSYKKLPLQTNADQIIKEIKAEESEVKKRSRPRIHWPYAASFIGVFLIGTVLALQLIIGNGGMSEPQQTDRTGSHDSYTGATSEELNARIESAHQLYELRKTQAMARLGLSESAFSGTLMDQDAQKHLLFVESIPKRDYPVEQKLEWVEKGESWIEDSLRTPDMMIGSLKRGMTIMESEAWTGQFLEDQRDLLPIYQEKLRQYKEWWKPHIEDGKLNVKSLNGIQHYPKEFRVLLDGITNNAVKLSYDEVDDELYASIDQEYVNMLSDHALPEVYVSYLEMKQSPILEAGEFTVDWNGAGDRLMLLEKLLRDLPENSRFRDEVRLEYETLYGYFVTGGVNQPIFTAEGKLKEEVRHAYEYSVNQYPSYKTAESIKEVLKELKKTDFMRPERWIQHPPVILSSEVKA
ncbi:hypothetical protein LCM10_19955 [Rossellomorea aquimaris]|uniref:hypothetical protein n=1 Tax=Rossellomorea aquimaris TaxID=189382 RepID=UPI001CD4470E|nr:hypothetical protein [Rossellomorea aquimaris]MCA1057223.1 hypothetical protein [Rossellomorea aquimaris]